MQRLRDDAVLPGQAYEADAGLDLASCEQVEIPPGGRAVVGTGLAVAIPEGYAGLVVPRSGLAARHGLGKVNAPGLIDPGYRGEVKVMLPKSGGERLIARIVYTGPVPAPVAEGTPIGKLKVWRNDTLALDMPLEAGADIEAGNLPQRAFDAASEMVISVFRAGADRL